MYSRGTHGELARPHGRHVDPAGHIKLSASDRRRYSRGDINADVRLSLDPQTKEFFAAKLIDISAGGARLRSFLVPRIGATIAVEIERLGVLKARVVRRFSHSIAVEFDIADNQREAFACRLLELDVAVV